MKLSPALAPLALLWTLKGAAAPSAFTYADLAEKAHRAQMDIFYVSTGTWHLCNPNICHNYNVDWGADSMTYNLYLYWRTTGGDVTTAVNALSQTQPAYSPTKNSWSDIPMWDAVAQARMYFITRSDLALQKARSAFAYVDTDRRADFASGACPAIDYQGAHGGDFGLKTLETDSNYVKAAVLLYEITHEPAYLDKAKRKYAAIRAYFLDSDLPLYTNYLFDDGVRCTPLQARFFASVNGNMIFSGYHLSRLTGETHYHSEAVQTAHAVMDKLSDGTGIFADLQAENDIVEPLIEAMFELAVDGKESFARTWLLKNADAAAASIRPDGTYGRFFNGPFPENAVSAWQANGGFALQFAAAALDPKGRPSDPGYWRNAVHVAHELTVTTTPGSFTFTGQAVAILGTIGEHCCESGHARVFIDGVETTNQVGVWQNKSSPAIPLPNSVLLAWRWPTTGTHTIEIKPSAKNDKEGESYFHMTGYKYRP